MYTRRHLLVAAGIAATAGCTGAFGDEGGQQTERGAVRLEELSVQNNHHRDQRLQLAVEADGEMVHLGTYDLTGDGGTQTIGGEWSDGADSYRVHARLNDEPIQTAAVTDGIGSGADCIRVLIRIDSDGELTVWHGTNCGSDADDADELESV